MNWQIALFGPTGGLFPCPAVITVLFLCLKPQELTLGAVLVLSFSIGLALTLVSAGVTTAISLRQGGEPASCGSNFAARAP